MYIINLEEDIHRDGGMTATMTLPHREGTGKGCKNRHHRESSLFSPSETTLMGSRRREYLLFFLAIPLLLSWIIDDILLCHHPLPMSTSSPFHFFLFRLIPTSIIIFASAQTDDNFCGATWDDASTSCLYPCPTGDDSECSFEVTGEQGHVCYVLTGCMAKIESGEIVILSPTSSPIAGVTTTVSPTMSPTLPTSSMSLARISLILSVIGPTSAMDVNSMAEFNATLYNYLREVMLVGGGGMALNTTNVTQSRLGDSFDYVDAYVNVDVLYDPSIVDASEGGDEEYLEAVSEWAYDVIEGHILGQDGLGTSLATILAKSDGMLGMVTSVFMRTGGPVELLYTAPASSNAMNANSTNENVTDSTLVSFGPTTLLSVATNDAAISSSASPSPMPSVGYGLNANITTSAPTMSSGPSPAAVPALTTGVDEASSESGDDLNDVDGGGSMAGTIVGIVAGILMPCIAGVGLLWMRTRRFPQTHLDAAKSHHNDDDMEIGPSRAEAKLKRDTRAYHPDQQDKRVTSSESTKRIRASSDLRASTTLNPSGGLKLPQTSKQILSHKANPPDMKIASSEYGSKVSLAPQATRGPKKANDIGGSMPMRKCDIVASHRVLETDTEDSNEQQVRRYSEDNVQGRRKSSRKCGDATLLRNSGRRDEDYIMRNFEGVAKDDNKRTNRIRRSTNDLLRISVRQDAANVMQNFEEVPKADKKRANRRRRSTSDLLSNSVRQDADKATRSFEEVAKGDNKRANRMRRSANDLLRSSVR